MAESSQNYRDLGDYIDGITTGNARAEAADLTQRLNNARPAFVNLLKYKVMHPSNTSPLLRL